MAPAWLKAALHYGRVARPEAPQGVVESLGPPHPLPGALRLPQPHAIVASEKWSQFGDYPGFLDQAS